MKSIVSVSTTVLLLFLVVPLAIGKVIEGEIVTSENWEFLTRFCFLSKDGRFHYKITYPKDYEVQKILLYYDSRMQWPSVYKKNLTCEEKEAVLSINHNQIINLTRDYEYSGCEERHIYNEDNVTLNSTVVDCSYYRYFESARERWWFIAVSNCNSKKGLKLTYKVTTTNDDGAWTRHFSADQFYILHTDIAFTTLYLILFMASIFEAMALRSRHLLHATYKMYMMSLALQFVALILLTTYYSLYARDGYSIEGLKMAGKSLEAVSTLVFLLLLILLAKGYTVTRARLKRKTSVKIACFMVVYTCVYIILFILEQAVFDPGEVLYLYESPAGYGLIFLRLLGWAWFVYAIVFTLMHYPAKSIFFTRLFLCYSIWFISCPVVVLISTLAVPKWMREKIINGVELLIAFEAHLVFYILTRPGSANKNFPFHIRTTQINVMSKPGESITGDSTLDRFSGYNYAPSRTVPSSVGVTTADRAQALTTTVGNIFSVTSAGVVQTALPPGYVTNGVPGEVSPTSAANLTGTWSPRPPNTAFLGYASGAVATGGGVNGQLPAVESDSRF